MVNDAFDQASKQAEGAERWSTTLLTKHPNRQKEQRDGQRRFGSRRREGAERWSTTLWTKQPKRQRERRSREMVNDAFDQASKQAEREKAQRDGQLRTERRWRSRRPRPDGSGDRCARGSSSASGRRTTRGWSVCCRGGRHPTNKPFPRATRGRSLVQEEKG